MSLVSSPNMFANLRLWSGSRITDYIKGELFYAVRSALALRYAALLFILVVIVSGCGGSSNAPPAQLPGYLSNCLVDDKLVRWTSMPVQVYIDKTDLPENWRPGDETLLRQALDQWAAASEGRVSFVTVSSPAIPGIHIKWVKDKPMGDAGAAGVSKLDGVLISGKNYFQDVRIEIATTSPNGLPFTDVGMFITSLHEIGHSLGLWGHSDDPSDLMYITGPSAGVAISPRDKLTLIALYSLTPDVTQVPAGTRARPPSFEYVLPGYAGPIPFSKVEK